MKNNQIVDDSPLMLLNGQIKNGNIQIKITKLVNDSQVTDKLRTSKENKKLGGMSFKNAIVFEDKLHPT